MTTIAVKDGVMACDSMEGISSEGGGDRAYFNSQKVYEFDGVFVGGSGDSEGILLWVEWYGTNKKKKGSRLSKLMWEYDFDMLLLHDDGSIQTSTPAGVFFDIGEPFYAIGSGSKCALAAMHMGADAEEAVKISTKVDPHTGGEIKVFRHAAKVKK